MNTRGPELPPVINGFDAAGGSRLERLLFSKRLLILAFCAVVTLLLGYSARNLQVNASYLSVIPVENPFIRNFLSHQDDLKGQGNALQIVVTTDGSILDADYLETLRQVNDTVYLLPGVDRPFMNSIWTPWVRWQAVTEQGFEGGPVMPERYDGSTDKRRQLKSNIERSGQIGRLIAPDFKSSMVFVPLLDIDNDTLKPLDYSRLSRSLEQVRTTYGSGKFRIHIVGFAKVQGDLINALWQIIGFFAVSILISGLAVLWFTRCVRSTTLVVTCSIIAVVWLLGLLPLTGYELDPYSILVPFLIFAIGMSHGAQKMNGVMQDIGRGMPRLVAARMTFRRLFLAGFTALVCDAVGFAVLLLVNIQAIRSLAIIASTGVAILIFTNLIVLPIMLSYVGVSARAAARSTAALTDPTDGRERHYVARALDSFTRPGPAAAAIAAALVIGAACWIVGLDLKIGDLDPGAPELRKTSRYNMDNAYLTQHYGSSSDVMVVMVTSPPGQCADYATLAPLDRLERELTNMPSVKGAFSAADLERDTTAALNEGNLNWAELIPNAGSLHQFVSVAPLGVFSGSCDMTPLAIYLRDHKADTLQQVVRRVQDFAAANDTKDVKFLLAAGSAGIEAATNQVVGQASRTMLFYVYGAVMALCLFTFRSWRGVLVAILPLTLTSLAAQALMVELGIGVKVATLPVTALGVGIGVDYALYILTVTLAGMRAGLSLSDAYYQALLFTGKVVTLTGITLASAVVTWFWSPIKFQADMGVLLAFMFLLNMAGALVLLPSLACFLLPGAALLKRNGTGLEEVAASGSPPPIYGRSSR